MEEKEDRCYVLKLEEKGANLTVSTSLKFICFDLVACAEEFPEREAQVEEWVGGTCFKVWSAKELSAAYPAVWEQAVLLWALEIPPGGGG